MHVYIPRFRGESIAFSRLDKAKGWVEHRLGVDLTWTSNGDGTEWVADNVPEIVTVQKIEVSDPETLLSNYST